MSNRQSDEATLVFKTDIEKTYNLLKATIDAQPMAPLPSITSAFGQIMKRMALDSFLTQQSYQDMMKIIEDKYKDLQIKKGGFVPTQRSTNLVGLEVYVSILKAENVYEVHVHNNLRDAQSDFECFVSQCGYITTSREFIENPDKLKGTPCEGSGIFICPIRP